MTRPTFIALMLVLVAGLLSMGSDARSERGDRRDYSRVMVIAHVLSSGCPPCRDEKADYPKIHQRYPKLYWAWAHDGQPPRKVRQYGEVENEYGGRAVEVDCYPTTIVYKAGKKRGDGYSEVFRVTGYNDRYRELLEAAIRIAAEE